MTYVENQRKLIAAVPEMYGCLAIERDKTDNPRKLSDKVKQPAELRGPIQEFPVK